MLPKYLTNAVSENLSHGGVQIKKNLSSTDLWPLHLITCLLSVLLLSACGTPPKISVPEPDPKLFTLPTHASSVSAPSLNGQVSRSQAIRHALTYNPTLQALRSELRAMQAEVTRSAGTGWGRNEYIGATIAAILFAALLGESLAIH